MRPNALFAVLDLETTGQSYRQNGKIIQIGLTFVKNGQIVDRFESFVNPGQLLDRGIQQLTHIAQSDVDHAPYFEEIAPILAARLADTVIVAHNVNFDYPYLSAAFVEAGLPALTNDAIDTVTLAQVLLPEAPGYRLGDVTAALQIELTQAHRANADSDATAALFLRLWELAAQLPAETLTQLATGQWRFIRQTQDFFKLMTSHADNAQFKRAYNAVMIREVTAPKKNAQTPSFNASQKQFIKQMELAHTQQLPFVQWEVAPKIGKIPAYVAAIQKLAQPVILLSDDADLRDEQAHALQQAGVPFALLRQAGAYLSLRQFVARLQTVESAPNQLQKARLLVWLTQTTTGDLSEIQVPLVPQLLAELQADSHDSGVSFYQAAWQKARQSRIWLFDTASFLREQTALDRLLDGRESLLLVDNPLQLLAQLAQTWQATLAVQDLRESLLTLTQTSLPIAWSKTRRHNVHTAGTSALQWLKKATTETTRTAVDHLLAQLALLQVELAHEDDFATVLSVVTRNLQAMQDWAFLSDVSDDALQINHVTTHLRWSVTPNWLWSHYFLTKHAKIWIVGELFTPEWRDFIAEQSTQQKWTNVERVVHNPNLPALTVVLPGEWPILQHLQALAAVPELSQITVILPTQADVDALYNKIRYGLAPHTTILAEAIHGSREKILRQLTANAQTILLTTPSFVLETGAKTGSVVVWPNGLLSNDMLLRAIQTTLQQNSQHPLLVANVAFTLPGVRVQTLTDNRKLAAQYRDLLSE